MPPDLPLFLFGDYMDRKRGSYGGGVAQLCGKHMRRTLVKSVLDKTYYQDKFFFFFFPISAKKYYTKYCEHLPEFCVFLLGAVYHHLLQCITTTSCEPDI